MELNLENLTQEEHLQLFNQVKKSYENKYLKHCVLVQPDKLPFLELVNYLRENEEDEEAVLWIGHRDKGEKIFECKGKDTDTLYSIITKLSEKNIINLKIKDYG